MTSQPGTPKTGNEIREAFLAYFEKHGHRRVASSTLVPEADPTLLFTNAGMVQFKRTFLGEEKRDYSRAVTSQKCMRVSGKHNDLENVGRTPRHHTFFEMLGNFSFGDYFKQEAIQYAWELVTEVYGISPDNLVASVYQDDDEAYRIWQSEIGIPEAKLYRLGESENFWSMGDTGPCGPCSEIHVDFGRPPHCTSDPCDPSCECGRFLEIWNLVFMQYNRSADGRMDPLPKPSVDTGAGLERLAAVLQDAGSNYGTDLFRPILNRIHEVSGVALGSDPEKDVSMRVVADHARAVSFLLCDGVLPSNEGRGYVLRRILRRAARHGVLLGMEEPFLFKVADAVIDEMSGAYPDLSERRVYITDRVRGEEERFLETLSKGLRLLEDEIGKLEGRGESVLPGEIGFRLYDTYGFPVDLTEDILRGRELSLDSEGFEAAMSEQRARARAAWKGSGDEAVGEAYGRLAAEISSAFRGYDTLHVASPVRALLVDGSLVESASQGDNVEVVVDETPFYAESGGQVGDRGVIRSQNARVEIEDTQRPSGELVVHRGRVLEGTLNVDDLVDLEVDAEARSATVRNHSGTHLLHAALREVLGPQAMQKGSLVAPDRLRFDFTHDHPLSDEEIERIEDLTNRWIETNAPAEIRYLPYKEAIEAGAIAIFEEKYGDVVRLLKFGDFSVELCGGTHAQATGDIGVLKVLGETGIAAGVRRIEALTGMGALEHMRAQERQLRELASLLKVPVAELPTRVEKLIEERKGLQQDLDKLRSASLGAASTDLAANAKQVGDVSVLAARIDDVDPKELRKLVDDLRDKLGSGIVLLGVPGEGKVAIALGITKDLTKRYRAGDLIREVAGVLGGKGGGRPDFAQAGGSDPSKLDEAFEKLYELVEQG